MFLDIQTQRIPSLPYIVKLYLELIETILNGTYISQVLGVGILYHSSIHGVKHIHMVPNIVFWQKDIHEEYSKIQAKRIPV